MICKGCHADVPADDFYAGSTKCKECVKARVRVNYRATIDARRAYERARNKEPGRKLHFLKALRQQRANHPDRCAARTALNNAVRDGRVVRGSCEVCGVPKAQAHHDDYSKPLDVRWLCKPHHDEHHGKTIRADEMRT